MPGSFLTDTERERLRRFPSEVSPEDLGAYFTLSDRDRIQVRRQRGDSNRLGFALQLCTLRYLGFVPNPLRSAPPTVIAHLALQLGTAPESLAAYGDRPHTRTDDFQEVIAYLGFRKARAADVRDLRAWLVARALEHDRLTFLLQLACEKLRTDKVVRPGPTSLERLVAAAQQEAQRETFRLLGPLLTGTGKDTARRPARSRSGQGRDSARLAPPCRLIQLAEGHPGVHREDRLLEAGGRRPLVARRPEPQPPQAARPGRPAGQRAGPATDAGGAPVSDPGGLPPPVAVGRHR